MRTLSRRRAIRLCECVDAIERAGADSAWEALAAKVSRERVGIEVDKMLRGKLLTHDRH